MGKRDFPMMALLLALAYLPIVYGAWAIGNMPGSPMSTEPVSGEYVSWDKQCEVARHEAGHALAVAYLFGARRIVSLRIWTKTDERHLFGMVLWTKPSQYTLLDTMKSAVVCVAGRAADATYNGGPTIGARSDLVDATADLMSMRIDYGLGGALVVKPTPGQSDYDAVDALLKKANVCATALVESNPDLIEKLAYAAVHTKIKGEIRTLNHEELVRFFLENKIIAPRNGESGDPIMWPTDDPCYFPIEP